MTEGNPRKTARSNEQENPELDHFYALVLMHEQARERWEDMDEDEVEVARKLAAHRTELLKRDTATRKKRSRNA